MIKTRFAFAEGRHLKARLLRTCLYGATALLLSLLYLGGGAGCKVEATPGSGTAKDMSMKDDGGGSLCETEKCANPDTKCCNGEPCVDVKNNPLHCGDCGKICRTREVCSNGLCICRAGGRDDICPMDALCCGTGCHNIKTDTNNCGGCGLPCKMGEVCADGKCSCGPGGLSCKIGQVCCGTGCSDLMNDPKNCGKCGRECPMGMCKNGLCDGECAATCTFPTKCCNSICVDLANDPKNCGDCGKDCSKLSMWMPPTCLGFICLGVKPDMGADMMSMPMDMAGTD